MSEPNAPNHWDLLGSTLGASPPPEDSQRPSPPPAQQLPPQKPTSRESRPKRAPPAQQSSDWDALAAELGLPPELRSTAVPAAPTPETAAPPAAAERQPSPPAPPTIEEPGRRGPPPPETPEESPNFFDERFDFEEPFDLLESTEAASAAVEPSAESVETSEPSERRPRRRRRRGRGRGGKQVESQREPAVEQGEAEESTSEPHATEAGEPQERRPRHRRSRRGKKQHDVESTATATGPHKEGPPETAHADDELDADMLADEHIALDEGEEHDDQQSARLGFRGIPSWEDTVGLLIDKNIEVRSKRPAGAPHHGRGNHGRGDQRAKNGGKHRPN